MDIKEKLRQFVFGKKRVKVSTILQMEVVECGAAGYFYAMIDKIFVFSCLQ